MQYDRVCKSFRSLFFIAYSRGVKAKWLYSPNVTTLREYLLRNLKSLILCYYFMRMLFVWDFSKCLSAVYHLLERDSKKIESSRDFSFLNMFKHVKRHTATLRINFWINCTLLGADDFLPQCRTQTCKLTDPLTQQTRKCNSQRL